MFTSIKEAIQHSLNKRTVLPVLKLHNKQRTLAAKKSVYKYTGLKALFVVKSDIKIVKTIQVPAICETIVYEAEINEEYTVQFEEEIRQPQKECYVCMEFRDVDLMH